MTNNDKFINLRPLRIFKTQIDELKEKNEKEYDPKRKKEIQNEIEKLEKSKGILASLNTNI